MNHPRTLQKGVPNEFDLSRYEETAHFDEIDWFVNIESRILRTHNYLKHADYMDLREIAYFHLLNPIYERRNVTATGGFVGGSSASVVESQSAFDALSNETWFRPNEHRMSAYVDAYKKVTSDDFSSEPNKDEWNLLQQPLWKMHSDGKIIFDGIVTAAIDLHSSEEKAVSDFKKWFKITREKLNIPDIKKKIDQKDLDSWHTYRILPYLDLKHWFAVHNISVTHSILGAAIFPEEYDRGLADRIRKTVMPMAERLATFAQLDALRSQILNGETERKC